LQRFHPKVQMSDPERFRTSSTIRGGHLHQFFTYLATHWRVLVALKMRPAGITLGIFERRRTALLPT
jgi:hypothetical protein